jgi:hypothetical protein
MTSNEAHTPATEAARAAVDTRLMGRGGEAVRTWATCAAALIVVMWSLGCGATSRPIGRLEISLEDARLSAAVRTALMNDRELGRRRISIDARDGVVILSGTVGSVYEAERAVTLARSCHGVRDVKSSLRALPEK